MFFFGVSCRTFKKCGRCRKRTASIYCFTCEVFMCDNCDEDEPAHQAHEAARTTTTTTSITTTTHTDSHSDAASAVESVVPRASTVVSRSSSSSSLSALGTNGHVRVPLLDAIAILQMRKADALLDTGTLGALYVKPVLSDAAARKAALASQRSWLSRSSGRLDDRRVLRSSLIIVPNWCWKCETLSSGSTLGVGASSCQLRAWRRPILVRRNNYYYTTTLNVFFRCPALLRSTQRCCAASRRLTSRAHCASKIRRRRTRQRDWHVPT